jgi:DNA polymerase I-like protein with 3'-5' exonuclease and polymerase domains
MGIQTIGQFHDEVIALTEEGKEDVIENVMDLAIKSVNQDLQLNVVLGVDAQFGKSYAEIH